MRAAEQTRITDGVISLPGFITDEHIWVPLFWHWCCAAFQDSLLLTRSTFTHFQKSQTFGTPSSGVLFMNVLDYETHGNKWRDQHLTCRVEK